MSKLQTDNPEAATDKQEESKGQAKMYHSILQVQEKKRVVIFES